ncbi:MAG TPA: glycosyltransferase, partial [Pseudomonadales bacterium]|nr:glycosyltransferase [Pseudomonadales bacterium]
AGAGHQGPVMSLAQAFRDHGHDVFVAVPQRVAADVERSGLACRSFADLDPEISASFWAGRKPGGDIGADNAVVCRELFGRLNTTAALPGMRAVINEVEPQLIVREPFEPASWLAAEAAGVPTVMVPCCTWSAIPSVTRLLHEGVRHLFTELDIDPSNAAEQGARMVITATPEALDAGCELPKFVVRRGSRHPPHPRRAKGGRPRIFICFGTVAGHLPGILSRIGPFVLEAVNGLDVDCDFPVGRGVDASQLGKIPANVRVTDFLPAAEAIPGCRLTVCHGGYGTILATLTAGVPTLTLPLFSYDQWETAAAVARAGAGTVLDTSDQTSGNIAQAINSLLTDGTFAARAQQIEREMQSHATDSEIIQRVEEMVA